MTAVVFVGPTLSAAQAHETLAAEFLPPVRQGDVYRAVVRHRPRAIGIVDGIFQHVPAVWHKEILWAMTQGVHVFGAASMGALRAAELCAFGMQGVGRIFEAYRSGVLEPFVDESFEDDDEVAVIHGPAETGYVALSEAMVNIRCTLAAAELAGVIGAATRDSLSSAAKRMFYQERSYESLIERAGRGTSGRELSGLRQWLVGGRINQKRDDAQAMLVAMAALLEADPAPLRVRYAFAHTTLWENARAEIGAAGPAGPAGPAEGAVLDELRLDRSAYLAARRDAHRRRLALRQCEPEGDGPARNEVERTLALFRRSRGLFSRDDLDKWLAENDLDDAALMRLVREETRLQALEDGAAGDLDRHILDHLRLSGSYGSLAARTREKGRALTEPQSAEPPADSAMGLRALVWYFEDRLGLELPADLDAYARSLGFAGESALMRAVWRDFLFRRRAAARDGD